MSFGSSATCPANKLHPVPESDSFELLANANTNYQVTINCSRPDRTSCQWNQSHINCANNSAFARLSLPFCSTFTLQQKRRPTKCSQDKKGRKGPKESSLTTDHKSSTSQSPSASRVLGSEGPTIDQKELCLNTIVNKSLRPCGHHVHAEVLRKGLSWPKGDWVWALNPAYHRHWVYEDW